MTELAMPVTPGPLHEKNGDLRLELLRFELHPAHHSPTYQFHMVHRETREIVGNIRLTVGSTPHLERYAGHVGYGVLAKTSRTPLCRSRRRPAASSCL